MQTRNTRFVGKSGEFEVMSQLLMRGLNVGQTAVDTGDDVYVITVTPADGGTLYRLQVKSASPQIKGIYQFKLNKSSLRDEDRRFYHVFAIYRYQEWQILIIRTSELKQLYEGHTRKRKKSTKGATINIKFKYKDGRFWFKNVELTKYLNDWENWPPPVNI